MQARCCQNGAYDETPSWIIFSDGALTCQAVNQHIRQISAAMQSLRVSWVLSGLWLSATLRRHVSELWFAGAAPIVRPLAERKPKSNFWKRYIALCACSS